MFSVLYRPLNFSNTNPIPIPVSMHGIYYIMNISGELFTTMEFSLIVDTSTDIGYQKTRGRLQCWLVGSCSRSSLRLPDAATALSAFAQQRYAFSISAIIQVTVLKHRKHIVTLFSLAPRIKAEGARKTCMPPDLYRYSHEYSHCTPIFCQFGG